MKVNELTLPPKYKIKFSLSSYYKLPQKSGCYVMTTHNEDILYIGKSDNIQRRFKEHLNDSNKTGTTSKGHVVWFHWLECDEKKLRSLEGGWLNFYSATIGERPIMNLIDAPA